jgi:uncharacterized protein
MDAHVELEVRDVPGAGRYEMVRHGEVIGYASYRVQDGRAIVSHVEVDRSVEGQGLGGELVRGVLDDLRRRELKVTPLCGFAAAWIRRHPEYRDLVA